MRPRSINRWLEVLLCVGGALAVACSGTPAQPPDDDAATARDGTADGPVADRPSLPDGWPDVRPDVAATDAAGGGGWGAKCSQGAECLPGFECKSGKTDLFGFCTKSCSPAGSVCASTDLPQGTMSYCALLVGGTYYCGFLCKLGTTSYPCPGGMTCGTQETPPGTQQYWCVSQ